MDEVLIGPSSFLGEREQKPEHKKWNLLEYFFRCALFGIFRHYLARVTRKIGVVAFETQQMLRQPKTTTFTENPEHCVNPNLCVRSALQYPDLS